MKNRILEKSNEVFILVQSGGCDKVVGWNVTWLKKDNLIIIINYVSI
jgi:hypothetical protein